MDMEFIADYLGTRGLTFSLQARVCEQEDFQQNEPLFEVARNDIFEPVVG